MYLPFVLTIIRTLILHGIIDPSTFVDEMKDEFLFQKGQYVNVNLCKSPVPRTVVTEGRF